ncbi:MAG: hypothetical protein PHW60_08630 [Kiritimatiellae bacterium]|nr:hypothetical protein [Kiritimatiellia bacterium]
MGDILIDVKHTPILTGSFLLLLFAIGIVLLPVWHKANLGAFSAMLTQGASNAPIKKNNESGKASRTEHNTATCMICRVASMAFASPTPAVIPAIGTLFILGFIHPSNVVASRVFLALPPVRAPPPAHS